MPQLDDLLARARGPAIGASGGAPARRPLYRPAERNMLSILYEALQGGLDPMQFLDAYSGINQGAQDRRATRRQSRLDQISGYKGSLIDAAMSGVPPEGIDALSQALIAGNPALGRVQPSRLDEIVESASELAGSLPAPEAEAVAPLTIEDIEAIDEDVRAWATGTVKRPDEQPYTLRDATMAVAGQLRMQGYSEEQIAQIRNYIAQKWREFGGPDPSQQIISGPPEMGGGPMTQQEQALIEAAQSRARTISGGPFGFELQLPFG